jgi:hypothetical protein
MNDFVNWLAIAWMALLWTTVGMAIQRWGPGSVEHHAQCPERKKRADFVVRYAEGDFGSIYPADVTRCSLLGDGPVTCDRACLAQV